MSRVRGGLQPESSIAIVTPMLNEASELYAYREAITVLEPPPSEIILVDGGSDDRTVELAKSFGFDVIEPGVRGRAAQINAGVAAINSDLVCVLHADSKLPVDAISVIRNTLYDEKTSLGGFTVILTGENKTRWITSFHNWIKTWYVPLLFRPWLFARGGRLLFGDHAMFFRHRDFLSVGGCDDQLLVMEDADLCLRLVKKGRIRLINRFTYTSDRRVEKWGGLKANMVYLSIGLLWGFGFKKYVNRFYPDIRRTD